ncbi:MAG: DEAD/DEAH box helicase [Deltaproteobacteria bacterium]|nr:DEAD/DEAH box helicase [Deltaproteobacteria bacterium]
MELRPYQLDALDAVEKRLKESPRVLLQAPTGSGKSILFAELTRRFMTGYEGMRIGIVAHREELVRQAADKILKVWPEGFFCVGTACASAGQVELEKPVTVGSVQTMARRKFAEPFKMLICDEAHHIGSQEAGGQYYDLIRAAEAAYPPLRVLGVTATPYRTSHGPIWGDTGRPDRTNFFPTLDWKLTLDDLIAQGYLADWRGKVPVDISGALGKVGKVMGEYDERRLSEEMSRPVHIGTAVDAFARYGEGRRHVLVFAVSIAHAELLAEAFRTAGHRAEAVHSKMDRESRRAALDGFGAGEVEVLVNVGVLTEGWDSPAVDLIIMCRPTMSPGLYVQMLGRGTRLALGKKDLLFIDLANNWRTHGDPSSPELSWPSGGSGEPPMKICGNPDCMSLVHLSAKTCPVCGYKFPEKDRTASDVPELKEIARPGGLPEDRERKSVTGWYLKPYLTRAGDLMARLDVHFETGRPVFTYLDFERAASARGFRRAARVWRKLAGKESAVPATVEEAVSRTGELVMPPKLGQDVDSGGYRIIREWK